MKNANKPQPTIICIDCNKTVLRTGSRQKRCFDCRMIEEDRLRRDCKYRNAVKRGIIKNPGTRSRRNDSANLEKPK